jgi:ferrous iron transport protein B
MSADADARTRPRRLTIALAGNPNSGKTTIFNAITGTRQKVGNWPGVTVEKKEGQIEGFGYDLRIVDLPGTYSLTPFSIEEIVARDFVLDGRPDVVIDIIDASNLERSLYLATQLREIDCKVLFALNMADLARSRGLKIDAVKLGELLDLPVVFTVGNRHEGIDELLRQAIALAETGTLPPQKRRVRYTQDIEGAIAQLRAFLDTRGGDALGYNPRWAAIKLLEDDQIIKQRLTERAGEAAAGVLEEARRLRRQLADRYDDEPEIVMTDERYGFIAGIVREVQTATTRQRVDMSRNIDLILTNRFLGFPIFVFFIWAMFQLTFALGAYPMGWIEAGVEQIGRVLDLWLAPSLLRDLIIDGVVSGVGSVVVFLPNILILFFCIALFEDTGYMARAAFLMDRIMHLIGLHGKSFIPMLMGFGCNVPAVMAARSLESEKDRVLTILVTPFMSCSARLPVYLVLAGTFFAAQAGTVIFVIYLLGIVIGMLSGRLFRKTLLRGQDAPFVMELPPYRVPMAKSLVIHMWDRSKMFLRKMGGVILVGSVIVWALSAFPRQVPYHSDYSALERAVAEDYQSRMAGATGTEHPLLAAERDGALEDLRRQKRAEHTRLSYLGRIGQFIEPVFRPMGIDWRGGVALLSGVVAKEIVVSTMGVLYGADSDDQNALGKALGAAGMTPLAAAAMMVFVLLYVPCLATVAAVRREAGNGWMAFSVLYSTVLAWVAAVAVYQGGRLMGLG